MLAAIQDLVTDFLRWFLLIIFFLIPYGILQENLIYPNNNILNLEDKLIFVDQKPKELPHLNRVGGDDIYDITLLTVKRVLEKGLISTDDSYNMTHI